MDNSASSSAGSSIPIPKSKRGLKTFLKEVQRELKKVNWPSIPEAHRLTGIVLVVCGMMIAILTGLSVVLQKLVDFMMTGRVG